MSGWIRVSDTTMPFAAVKRITVVNTGGGDHLLIETTDGSNYTTAASYATKADALAAAQLVALGQLWE